MQSRKTYLCAVLLGVVAFSSFAVGQQTDPAIEARQAIQKIYDSPLYRSGTSKHPHSLRWPSSYTVDENSYLWLRTIQKFSLRDGKATVVIEYHDSVSATDPETKKVVKIEAIDTNEDVWSKPKGEWISNQSKHLSSIYLIDGKSQGVMYAVPEKDAGK